MLANSIATSSASIAVHDLSRMDPAARAALMLRIEDDLNLFIKGAEPIITAVREQGNAALAAFAEKFDGAILTADQIAVTSDDFLRARQSLAPEIIDSIYFAAQNISHFHQRQKPESMWVTEIQPGAFAGERWGPIPSVACYVPRGKGAFPSVCLMTTIPAQIAGVKQVAVFTPPGPDGNVDAATLVAADAAGVTQVYKCGGAQAVAAAAYGTATIPRFDKIVGPGSPWVSAARRLLADRIDPGTPAGPSESIIMADAKADGRLAALDLIIESEHGPDSSAFLVTDSPEIASVVQAAIPEFWAQMGAERVAYSTSVLGGPRGGIVLTPSIEMALDFINDYAPEHLHIHTEKPWEIFSRVKNAGEILMGPHTPLTLGNFVLGPNAVLPTGGSARIWSALSVFDFLKRISIGYVTGAGYERLAPHALRLARYEGFDGHANAVSSIRDEIFKNKK